MIQIPLKIVPFSSVEGGLDMEKVQDKSGVWRVDKDCCYT